MHRLLIALTMTMLLGLGCSGGEESYSEQDLRRALLVEEDLPFDWTTDVWKNPAEVGAGICTERAPLAVSGAGVLFYVYEGTSITDSPAGYVIQSFESGGAKRTMDMLRDEIESCGEWLERTDSANISYSVTQLSFPEFGDEVVAVREQMDYRSTSIDYADTSFTDFVYVRKGNLFLRIYSNDTAETEEIARLIVDKLAVLD